MNDLMAAAKAYQMSLMTGKPLGVIFNEQELKDIQEAALERGRSIHGLIHDAVMEALYK